MRSNRKAAVLVSAALCGSLALGATAVAATAATEQAAARQAAAAPAPAPAPGPEQAPGDPEADALLKQAVSLGSISGVLKPVTDLVAHALAERDGKASPEKLEQLRTSVVDALAAMPQAAEPQAAPADRGAVPAPPSGPDVSSLKAHLAALLDAVTKADLAAVVGAAKATLGDLTQLVLGAVGQPSAQVPAQPGRS